VGGGEGWRVVAEGSTKGPSLETSPGDARGGQWECEQWNWVARKEDGGEFRLAQQPLVAVLFMCGELTIPDCTGFAWPRSAWTGIWSLWRSFFCLSGIGEMRLGQRAVRFQGDWIWVKIGQNRETN